ncbi:helix-turn-helix domain-containing protein [Actinokineospora pegani]|uniref:helix-turn-helix domain-containing protein n=1 Tax=Actinokineospora pegani TaxID=2654637 RepID=UPI001F167BD5|nr:helix-turn-helix transcriptional regulator [Actinokineospora pegani]
MSKRLALKPSAPIADIDNRPDTGGDQGIFKAGTRHGYGMRAACQGILVKCEMNNRVSFTHSVYDSDRDNRVALGYRHPAKRIGAIAWNVTRSTWGVSRGEGGWVVGVRREAFTRKRESAGFTQESFAAALGVEFSTVGRWERGDVTPAPHRRGRIASVLGITLDELDDLLTPPRPSTGMSVPADPEASQAEWLRVRDQGGARGRELSELAAWLYDEHARGPGGHVLTGPGWLLDTPVPLDEVRIELVDDTPPVPDLSVPLDHVLPLTSRGERYSSYSRAVRDLVRPRLMENRISYRLLDVDPGPPLTMRFGTTTFFEVFDRKQYLAHEFKGAALRAGGQVPALAALPLRAAIVDPFDLTGRPVSPSISTLTIRRDPIGGHRFTMHQRDPKAVATGGGMCTVMPAGEFQPSTMAPATLRHDFSLWRNIMREYSEEYLGNPEHDGASPHIIDYGAEEPFASFERAKALGGFRLWHYGLVVDALTLGPSQRTVAVIDHDVYDTLFADAVQTNDEGHRVGHGGRTDIPFTAEAIDRLAPRLTASSYTGLRLAWRDRNLLLD